MGLQNNSFDTHHYCFLPGLPIIPGTYLCICLNLNAIPKTMNLTLVHKGQLVLRYS
jgi:hypothetical protein